MDLTPEMMMRTLEAAEMRSRTITRAPSLSDFYASLDNVGLTSPTRFIRDDVNYSTSYANFRFTKIKYNKPVPLDEEEMLDKPILISRRQISYSAIKESTRVTELDLSQVISKLELNLWTIEDVHYHSPEGKQLDRRYLRKKHVNGNEEIIVDSLRKSQTIKESHMPFLINFLEESSHLINHPVISTALFGKLQEFIVELDVLDNLTTEELKPSLLIHNHVFQGIKQYLVVSRASDYLILESIELASLDDLVEKWETAKTKTFDVDSARNRLHSDLTNSKYLQSLYFGTNDAVIGDE